jgi:hypothetical protein
MEPTTSELDDIRPIFSTIYKHETLSVNSNQYQSDLIVELQPTDIVIEPDEHYQQLVCDYNSSSSSPSHSHLAAVSSIRDTTTTETHFDVDNRTVFSSHTTDASQWSLDVVNNTDDVVDNRTVGCYPNANQQEICNNDTALSSTTKLTSILKKTNKPAINDDDDNYSRQSNTEINVNCIEDDEIITKCDLMTKFDRCEDKFLVDSLLSSNAETATLQLTSMKMTETRFDEIQFQTNSESSSQMNYTIDENRRQNINRRSRIQLDLSKYLRRDNVRTRSPPFRG